MAAHSESESLLSELESSTVAWLAASGGLERLEQARAVAGGGLLQQPFLLQVDVLELANAMPELAQAFYDNAGELEGFRQMAHALLVANGKLHSTERLWLRPHGLAAEACDCVEALALLRHELACTLVVHGVCCATTGIFPRRYCRTFTCDGCGAEHVALEGDCVPACCGAAFVKEDPAKAVVMQAQVIYLAQVPHIGDGAELGENTIAVHLRDDLCGRARVGDQLLVVGTGQHVVALDASSALWGCRPTLQVDAVGLDVVPPMGPAPCFGSSSQRSSMRVQPLPPALAPIGLEGLVGALGCCFDAPCSPLLRLALLLSAATAGVQAVQLGGEGGAEEEEEEAESWIQQRATANRSQVNLLLLTRGPEPHLQRLLQQAASGLCQLSAADGPDPKQLLPRLFAKHTDPGLQLQLPLAMGGTLAEANGGVLLLNTAHLAAKGGMALAGCLRAGSVSLQPNLPEAAVPISPTVWCLAQDQDLGKGAARGKSSASTQPGEVAARLAGKYGGSFLACFDIQMDCCSEELEDLDLWADQLLSAAQRRQQAVQAACTGSTGADQHRAVAQVECEALAALQAHLAQAVALRHPRMTSAAMALLSAYFSMIRLAEESPQGVLASLARVATACARLHLRQEVLPFPDAAVAVLFMEEQIVARGGAANQWAKWKAELERGTDLSVCLEGLFDTLQDCCPLAMAGGAEE